MIAGFFLCLMALTLGDEPVETVAVDRDKLSGIEDRTPVRTYEQNYDEARSYDYLLTTTHKMKQPDLASQARRDITFAHLFEEPEKHRAEVVHLEGRLRRLLKFDASRSAAKDGVPTLYEGWLYTPTSFSNPYCIIASELPEGMKTGEKVEYKVAFDGYFFKRYRYKAADGWRDAPLLIGRGLRLLENTPDPETSEGSALSTIFVPALLGLLGVTALLAVGLTWWFRRGDSSVQQTLDLARAAPFVDPDENG
jgi:hypothetical protein